MKKYYLIFTFLICYSVGMSQTITELSFYAPLVSTFETKYMDNHLVVSQQGLKIFNVANTSSPQFVTQVSYPGSYAYLLEVDQDLKRAYMAKGGSGYFSVYDLSNISSPSLSGSLIISSTAFVTSGDLISNGNYVYMSNTDSLFVIDVSVPSSPQIANLVYIPNAIISGIGDMAIIDDHLYIQSGLAINIYDISNPALPVYVTSIFNSHSYNEGLSVDTINNRIFAPWLANLQTHIGYTAYDVINPASPVVLFSDSTTFGGADFGVSDYYSNYLMISEFGSVHAFDVSPANHHYITQFIGQNVANASISIEFRDSVFFNARKGGFEVLLLAGGVITSANNAYFENSFELFPVPSNEYLVIKGIGEAGFIEIFNSVGKRVYRISTPGGELKLDTYDLIPGIYFINYSHSKGVNSKKFIKLE